ncbi:MAG: HAMP domain-containing protein [Peptococcaceae bacterium]|nr:HAMP domain-containing protein [Peptococcaceae bacterium]
MKIQTKFFYGLVLLLVLPQLIGLYLVYNNVVGSVEKFEDEQILERYNSVNEIVDIKNQLLVPTLTTNTNWSDFRDSILRNDIQWIDENINSIQTVVKDIDFTVTTDLQGKTLSSINPPEEFKTTLNNTSFFKNFGEEATITGLYQTSKGLTLISVGKVYDSNGEGSPSGLCLFGKIIETSWLEQIKKASNAEIALVTSSGLYTTTKTDDTLLQREFTDKVNTIGFTKSIEGKQKKLGAYGLLNDISGQPVALLYVEAKSAASVSLSSNLKIYILCLVTTILITIVLFAIYLQKTVVRPINNIFYEADKISKGNLTGNKVELKTNDELGKLAGVFNSVLVNLKEIVALLQDKSNFVTDYSNELSASAENVTVSASKTTSTVGQVNDNLDQVSTNIAQVASVFQQASQYAEEGTHGINRITVQMDSLQRVNTENVEVITELKDSASKITQIVDIITQIADQTSLLALNAAIEAARAGEQGRGFAIVSEEVRKLAEQSAGATKEIYTLVTNIQTESEKAVQSASGAKNQVGEGLKVINEVGQVFAKIISIVQSLAGEINSVSYAAKEVSSAMHVVSSSAEEQTATMEEVSSTINSLAQMAEELNQIAKRFKLV